VLLSDEHRRVPKLRFIVFNDDNLVRGGTTVLPRDGAPHQSRCTHLAGAHHEFRDEKEAELNAGLATSESVPTWLVTSPDVSPIENVGASLDRRPKEHHVTTLAGMRSLVDRLSASMCSRTLWRKRWTLSSAVESNALVAVKLRADGDHPA